MLQVPVSGLRCETKEEGSRVHQADVSASLTYGEGGSLYTAVHEGEVSLVDDLIKRDVIGNEASFGDFTKVLELAIDKSIGGESNCIILEAILKAVEFTEDLPGLLPYERVGGLNGDYSLVSTKFDELIRHLRNEHRGAAADLLVEYVQCHIRKEHRSNEPQKKDPVKLIYADIAIPELKIDPLAYGHLGSADVQVEDPYPVWASASIGDAKIDVLENSPMRSLPDTRKREMSLTDQAAMLTWQVSYITENGEEIVFCDHGKTVEQYAAEHDIIGDHLTLTFKSPQRVAEEQKQQQQPSMAVRVGGAVRRNAPWLVAGAAAVVGGYFALRR